MGDARNEYDFTPPTEPEAAPRKPGPPPAKLDACKSWLAERLAPDPARVKDVRTEGCTDKRATEELARAAESQAARIRAGLSDPKAERMAEAGRRPIMEHLTEFIGTKAWRSRTATRNTSAKPGPTSHAS
jgi:hypothetical protein